MFNLAAIPSDSTGNSTEQDVQEQPRASRGPASHVLLVLVYSLSKLKYLDIL